MLKYVMKQQLLTRIMNRDGSATCDRCGREIEVGEAVVSTKSQAKHGRVFHESCYDSMLISC